MNPTSVTRSRRKAALTALSLVTAAALALLAALAVDTTSAAAAGSAGNASVAVGFIEDAQNSDGGFGARQGEKSDPTATLWATVALLSAGKHPADEVLVGGKTLLEYLQAHASSYTSLSDLGLLAMVRASASLPTSDLGAPSDRLTAALTETAVVADPQGAALAVLGLVADGSDDATALATSVAQSLLAGPLADGGWGPGGRSDSASTALVLQALAASGVADKTSPEVAAGVAVLKAAQGNDGSIAVSSRTDLALSSGNVAATAFTVQALQALGLAPLANSNGKTVVDGLTQYQQQTSGGLCDDCAYYSQLTPLVIATAQAFPAFNGVALPPIAVTASGAKPRTKTTPTPSATPQASASSKPSSTSKATASSTPSPSKKPNRVSSGTETKGASGATLGAKKDAGAFKGSQVATTTDDQDSDKGGAGDQQAGQGTGVTGQVVTPGSTLVTAAGADSSGITAQDRAAIALGVALGLALLLGLVSASRRPRLEQRSAVTAGLEGTAHVWTQARVRGALSPLGAVAIGAVLVLVPVTTGLFDKAPQGATMLAAFSPYMNEADLATYQSDVDTLDAGVTEALDKGPALLYPALDATSAQTRFETEQTTLSSLSETWPDIDADFQQLTTTVSANLGSYQKVSQLPFDVFGWFFVVPGTALMLLGLAGLVPTFWRRRSWPALRWVALLVGVGLVLAPSAYSLWDRAPAGAEMVDALAGIESTDQVTALQDDFGRLTLAASGLGTLTSQLQQQGLTTEQIDQELPAVAAFQERWVTVLQDFTPLLGVLSDNVARYQAVASLPSLAAFPWLFVVPGTLVILLVAGSVWRTRRQTRTHAFHEPQRRTRTGARAPRWAPVSAGPDAPDAPDDVRRPGDPPLDPDDLDLLDTRPTPQGASR